MGNTLSGPMQVLRERMRGMGRHQLRRKPHTVPELLQGLHDAPAVPVTGGRYHVLCGAAAAAACVV